MEVGLVERQRKGHCICWTSLRSFSASFLRYSRACGGNNTVLKKKNPISSSARETLKFSKAEVSAAIKKLNCKKAPGYDLIIGRVLQELPEIGYIYLTQFFNTILRLHFVPLQWKIAQVIMVPKPGKNPEDLKFHRSISLLPIPFKILEFLFLVRFLTGRKQHRPWPSIWIPLETRDNWTGL